MTCPFGRLEQEEEKKEREESETPARRTLGADALQGTAVRGRGESLAMAAITAALAVIAGMMTAGGTSGRANPGNFSAPTTFAIAEQLVADEAARHEGRKLPRKRPVAGGSGGYRSRVSPGGGKFFQADTFRVNAKKLISDPSSMFMGWDVAAWSKSFRQ